MALRNLLDFRLRVMNTVSPSSNRRWLVVVVLMLCCVGFVVRAHRELTPELRSDTVAAGVPSSTPVAAAGVSPSPRIKAVYFRITALGIEPSELTLPAGRYLVAIDNDSGFNAVDVKIDKEGGPTLASAQLPSGRRKWREFVDFAPGRHVLEDPNEAKRVCRLTITDQ